MLSLRQLNNGNTEKDSKTLLISYKDALQNVLLLTPFSFPCFSKHVKKRVWVNFLNFNFLNFNFLSDLAKGGLQFNSSNYVTYSQMSRIPKHGYVCVQ